MICTPSRLLVANSKPKMIGHRLESVQELPLADLGLVSVEGRNFMAGTESDQVVLKLDTEWEARNLVIAAQCIGDLESIADPLARLVTRVRRFGVPLRPMQVYGLANLIGPLANEEIVAAMRCKDHAKPGIDLIALITKTRLLARGHINESEKGMHGFTLGREDVIGVSPMGADSVMLLKTDGSLRLDSCWPTTAPLLWFCAS